MSNDLVHDEGGAALIEATLVLPLVILLVFGFVDLALYSWQRVSVTKAVQLGLRRAVVSDPVARGPGLTEDADEAFYAGLPQGLRCEEVAGSDRAACPSFDVRCSVGAACTCQGTRCGFAFTAETLAPILRSMRAVLPDLRAEEVEIGYRTNGLGYVGRPGAVPVDVTVRIQNRPYRPIFTGIVFRLPVILSGSVTAPGEDLRTN